MHKEHHIHTLDKHQDPELTSFYSRKELDSAKFMSVPSSRYSYFRSFILTASYLKTRICRLLSCSLGILTDYSGQGWSMTTSKDLFGKDIVLDLQLNALLQLAAYACIFSIFGRTTEGLCKLGFWWIFPNLVGYAFINFYRNAEHADCDFTTNQLLNTRTVESCRWIRWLLWETNYHCEHHCYPMVPFFNLPVLHELMNDHIKHNELKTFAGQNWALVKPGGWIDCQQKSKVKRNNSQNDYCLVFATLPIFRDSAQRR
jgi:Fatty acid desaturase